METARLAKRIGAYLINLFLYLGIGFGGAVPFLTLLNFHVALYTLIALGIAIVLSFILDILIMIASKGMGLLAI